MPTPYDFAAADRLHQQLSLLVAKIDGLLRLRARRRQTLLGDPHSDNWEGVQRNLFEADFARQQAALAELKSTARTLQANITEATAAAHAARKREQ